MKRTLLCLAFAYVAQARLIAVGFKDFSSDLAQLDTQSLQFQDSSSDDAYTQYPQQLESSWVNQQLDLLNTLQSYMLLSQTPRCGGHRRSQMTQMPPSTNTMNPVVVSYLATSRLGSLPSAFEAFSQDSDADIADSQQSSTSLTTDAVSIEDLVSSLLDSDAVQMQAQPEDSSEPEEAARSVMATAMSNVVPDDSAEPTVSRAEVLSEPWTAFDQLAVEQGNVDDTLDWGFIDAAGNVNWGFIIFSFLCLACGAVWLRLLHAWCALGRACLSCPRAQCQGQFMTLAADDMQSPLLAPLQHEVSDGPTGTIKSKSYHVKSVEVASEHVPEGVEYVSIAYVPLKGDE